MSKKLIAGALIALSGYAAGMSTGASAAHSPRVRIPHCAEDEAFLVGSGDFSRGRWTRYDCLHPEDLAGMAREDSGLARELVGGICEDARRYFYRQWGLSVMSEGCERAGARG